MKISVRSVIALAVISSPLAVGQGMLPPRLDLLRSNAISDPLVERASTGSIATGLEASTSNGRKNVGLAVLSSLLLPGMGELYVGTYGVGKYFTIAEGTLWLTYTSFELYGTWLRNDARLFAVSHAGVSLAGKDAQYFVDIGNFINIYEYNEKKLRDREIERLYNVASHFWQWDSDAHRASYREQRVSHDRVFNNSRFVIAAIIVNHISSAINAGRLAASHNKRVEQASQIQIHATVLGDLHNAHGIMVSVTTWF